MKNLFAYAGSILSIAVLSGCAIYGEAYIPAPPTAQVEVVGVAPYAEAIWVPGYWRWHRRHRQYVWAPGYWKGSRHHEGMRGGHGHYRMGHD